MAPKGNKSRKPKSILSRFIPCRSRSSSPSLPQTAVRTPSPLATGPPVAVSTNQPAVGPGADLKRLQNATKITFNGVQMLLKMVERSTDVIPIVKSPLAAFNACLELDQKIQGNRADLISLISRFDSLASFLAEQMNKDGRICETMKSLLTLAKSVLWSL